MRKLLLPVVAFVLICGLQISSCQNLDSVANYKEYLKYAVRVLIPLPSDSINAAGFLFELESGRLLFISNEHVFDSHRRLEIIIPAIDEAGKIVDTFHYGLQLFVKEVKRSFFIPGDFGLSDNIDIAAIEIFKNEIERPDKGSYYPIPLAAFAPNDILFPGQEIIISCYPLGKVINRYSPFLRKGYISGIDSVTDLIYLDAHVFPTLSGSPVFLDPKSKINNESGIFIGIISKAYEYSQMLWRKEYDRVEMLKTSSAGMGDVVPAEEIKIFLEAIADSLSGKSATD